ncbi:MAG: heavy metal translocating P-type ATPase [Eubacteriales bacterium]|nr:heavy metal translocating P-type ATPase [Clostridiales bacterium]MDY5732804.1 heavy metal translocating P-type ATPase [Eubacteriales bacterium]
MKCKAIRIAASAALLVCALIIKMPAEMAWLSTALYVASYVIAGYDIVFGAIKSIFRGNVFNENLLMSIASIGAFCVGEFSEGTAVMILFQIGEAFQDAAVDKSRRSISSLMNIRPDHANLVTDEGIIRKDPEDVHTGDVISITPGERVPLDCVILTGETYIDTSALSGETVPRAAREGDTLLSGSINTVGAVTARVMCEYGESTASRILDLVENASARKSNSEKFITRFSRYYTPIVVSLALILAIIPPLLIKESTFSEWIHRALSFLVVSCPCALVISIPLSFFGGIGGASASGILVKGGNYLEALAKVKTFVFDKTGTLTKGTFEVTDIQPQLEGISKNELLRIACAAERASSHPIAMSLKKKADAELVRLDEAESIREIAGRGVCASIDGQSVLVGNARLMSENGIECAENKAAGTTVHVAADGKYLGYIVISDEIKSEAHDAIAALKREGIERVVMLTGDARSVGRSVADELGMDECCAEQLPSDKVERVNELLEKSDGNDKLAFVGDGINDAPVLARADIGIAMGALGSDAAIEAADVVIMNDNLLSLSKAMRIARKATRIAKENTVFAIAVKAAVLVLSASGVASMWMAVFADVGVAVIAILNAMRTLRTNKM